MNFPDNESLELIKKHDRRIYSIRKLETIPQTSNELKTSPDS